MATHIYVRPRGRVMNLGTVELYLSVTIAGFPVLDSAIDNGFLNTSQWWPNLTLEHEIIDGQLLKG